MKAEIYYTCLAKYIAADGEKDKLLPRQAITLYPHLTTSKKLYNVALSRKYGSHGNQEFQMSSDFS